MSFKPDVTFRTPSGRNILFDGVAVDGSYVHAIETKLITNKSVVKSRVKKAFEQAHQVQEQWQGFDVRKLVFHLYLVLDSNEISEHEVKRQIEEVQENYPIRFKVEVVRLNDLKNEWQFCP